MKRVIFDVSTAVTAGTHTCRVGSGATVTLTATGLTGAEEIKIMQSARTGFSQTSVGGTGVALTVTNNLIQISGPRLVYFEKGVTVGSVELMEYSAKNI